MKSIEQIEEKFTSVYCRLTYMCGAKVMWMVFQSICMKEILMQH